MKVQAFALKLTVALFAGSALLTASLPAEARHDRSDHREWRSDFRGPPGHAQARGHDRYKQPKHRVVDRRAPVRHTVIVHEHHYPARAYYAPTHYPPTYYTPPRYAPPVRYGHPSARGYSREPAVVIGISAPPIIIPIR